MHVRIEEDGVEAEQYQIWFRDAEDYTANLALTLREPELLQTVLEGINIR